MHSSSKPNHLAQTIDHQRSAARSLPRHLANKCLKLSNFTNEIKTLLDNCLPTEILHTLWVGKYEDGHLTLSVQSQTAANHLRYQSNNLINILREQSFTFSQLKHIHVIVTYYVSENQKMSNNQQQTQNKISSSSKNTFSKTHSSYGLSDSTKRTISYTVEHVIKDERLKMSLKKLVRD